MHNVCNVGLPQAMGDVISSIGIGIGTAAADSIRYRAPAWYRSNPTCQRCHCNEILPTCAWAAQTMLSRKSHKITQRLTSHNIGPITYTVTVLSFEI